jgi:hypothetical protein
MPTGCEIKIRVPVELTGDALSTLRQRLLQETGLSEEYDFYRAGPLMLEPDEWAMPVKDGRWYNANLSRAFYSRDYPRGDLPTIVRVAEWLERNVPGAEIWYGNDCTDESMQPFGPEARDALMQHWHHLHASR